MNLRDRLRDWADGDDVDPEVKVHRADPEDLPDWERRLDADEDRMKEDER